MCTAEYARHFMINQNQSM